MGSPDRARRHWSPAELPGLDLLRARFVVKTFPRHTHDAFVIAAVSQGVEELHRRGGVERAAPGAVALLNPDAAHTGHAGTPEGWTTTSSNTAAEVGFTDQSQLNRHFTRIIGVTPGVYQRERRRS